MKLASLSLALSLLLGSPARAANPANPKANPAARAVLNYFHSLTNRPGQRIVSGQFANFS
jgi:hypothetical protein